MEIIVIIGLLGYIAYKEYVSHKERKDLYDRIMTHSLSDYKYVSEKPEPNEEDKEDEEIINIPTDDSLLSEEIKEEIENGGKES